MLKPARRAVASLEFAVAAPILLILILCSADGARALLIWAQIHNAASAIAQAAEKLSVTTDPTTGVLTSELTADQMQQAMSVIYAEIPGLNLGNIGGLFPGAYGVGLSSITYSPLCTAASGCGSQTAAVLWTTTLTIGGTQMVPVWARPCSYTPLQVAHLPNNGGDMVDMPSPVLAGGQPMTLAPQLVADVFYAFQPWSPLFGGQILMYATATAPAPIGGLNTTIALNTNASTGSVVACN